MSAAVLNDYGNFERDLEKAKSNLKDLNENIKRIFGKNDNFNERKRTSSTFESHRRLSDRSSPVNKRRSEVIKTKSVFSRLSGNKDVDFPKQKLQSRIVKEVPSREDVLLAQSADEESRARNKRMFGCLLGTLQKFCQEESRLKPKEEKKKEIEKKLEQQEKLEREKMRMEKQTLFSDRRRKQLEIKALEIKMYKVRDLAAWEESKKPLRNFIKTKTKPHIYYVPKKLNSKAEEKLKESKLDVEKMIEKKRKDVDEEIKEIEARFKRDIKALEEGKMSKAEMEDIDYDQSPYSDTPSDLEEYTDRNGTEIDITNTSYTDEPSSIVSVKKEKDENTNEMNASCVNNNNKPNKRNHSEDEADKELDDFLNRPIKKEKIIDDNTKN